MGKRIVLSGKNLSVLRKKSRMPVASLAKALGKRVTAETVQAWEAGTQQIPLAYHGKLFELFGYGLIDELEILPVRLKNIFLESFRQYGLSHNSEIGYGEFDGDEMFLEAILEISNIALKKSTDIKRKIVLSGKQSNSDVITGKAYTRKGISVGNNIGGGIVSFKDVVEQ